MLALLFSALLTCLAGIAALPAAPASHARMSSSATAASPTWTPAPSDQPVAHP